MLQRSVPFTAGAAELVTFSFPRSISPVIVREPSSGKNLLASLTALSSAYYLLIASLSPENDVGKFCILLPKRQGDVE